jgi:tol-pal system protein YbgF
MISRRLCLGSHPFAVLLLSGLCLLPFVAYAQSGSVAIRLDRLERDVETLSRSVFADESVTAVPAASHEASLELLRRLTTLEQTLTRLTARVEQIEFKFARLVGEMQSLGDDVTGLRDQLIAAPPVPPPSTPIVGAAPTTGTAMGAGTVTDPTTAWAPSSVPAAAVPAVTGPPDPTSSSILSDDATAAYNEAYGYIRGRDFEGARVALTQFIERFPDSAQVANALYWRGETYYARGDFRNAARDFGRTFQQYGTSSKAPDSLLKLALAFDQLGEPANACLALAELKARYPDGPAPVLVRGQSEEGRLGC